MKLQSQKSFVIEQLRRNGEISRNFCIENYITRLGAIIEKLNRSGWTITGAYRKNPSGKGRNYFYSLVSEPPKSPAKIMHERFQETGDVGQLKLEMI